jgi:hypothetical protein
MFHRMEMLRGMFILGRIATAHVPAGKAQAQVNPGIPGFHAVFAYMLAGLLDLDLIEMGAFVSHWVLQVTMTFGASDLGHVTKGLNHS